MHLAGEVAERGCIAGELNPLLQELMGNALLRLIFAKYRYEMIGPVPEPR
jgi:hypothetical protein